MLTLTNANEDTDQQELSLMAMGMQNGTSSFEHSLAVSYKLTIDIRWPSNCTFM